MGLREPTYDHADQPKLPDEAMDGARCLYDARAWLMVYKIKRIKKVDIPKPGLVQQPAQPGEILTGFIGSLKASDLEERSARALNGKNVSFGFRRQFIPGPSPIVISGSSGRNQLGAIEADITFYRDGTLTAVNIDGAFAHKTAEQIEGDRKKDAQLAHILRQLGGGQIIRIPFYFLSTQEQADQTWAQLLSGRTDFGSQG